MLICFRDTVERQLIGQHLELALTQIDPHEVNAVKMPALCFCAVCSALIDAGSVSTERMAEVLRQKYGHDFSYAALEIAMDKVQEHLDSQRVPPTTTTQDSRLAYA